MDNEEYINNLVSRAVDGDEYILAFQRIQEMGKRGWRLSLDFSEDGTVDEISGYAGDSNCHIAKEYDPSDGHGFSTFDCMQDARFTDKEKKNWEEGPISTEWFALMGEDGVPFTDAIAFAHRHIMAIEPGKPR